jgi:energy-coupling factor transporter ATP-binding protein EcfA2
MAMNTVISTTYELFNRKLFSLPKLLLLPSIVMRQPLLVVQMTPFIFGSDYLKAKVMAYLTTNIERLKKEKMELEAVRTKVESFDLKNAELLQRSGMGATSFTRHTWHDLTVKIQQREFMESFVTRTKGFFNWIQHHFVFSVMVDCALAQLIAVDKIQSADIFVFSRAIEDAVDTVLMKSRAESELARMMTQMERLQQLSDLWQAGRDRELLPCRLAPQAAAAVAAALSSSSSSSLSDANFASSTLSAASGIVLKNVHYSRGSAVVDIDHIDILPGVYALTGANGSGKSTLFRVLMSCSTNEKSTDLPVSIVFSSPALPIVEDDDPEDSCSDMDKVMSDEEKKEEEEERLLQHQQQQHEHHPKLEIIMPSSDVSEICQTFYWPLYTRPIDWIFQKHLSSDKQEDDIQSKARRVAELLQDLEFRQIQVDKNKVDGHAVAAAAAQSSTRIASGGGDASTTCMPVDVVMDELLEEKEDWFNDLSGGQKSKVELVRKVFIREKCPSVLLIDETMAPLDPTSKSLVMAKLKAFCQGSVVIVIYHTDVMSNSNTDEEGGDGESYECVPGNNFFDANLHLENRALKKRQLC